VFGNRQRVLIPGLPAAPVLVHMGLLVEKPAKGVRTLATRKPAAKVEKPAEQPAVEDTSVGIKQMAATLGRTPKSVRASIRRLKGGAQVGQGGRYRWDSENDPEFVALVTALQKSEKDEAE